MPTDPAAMNPIDDPAGLSGDPAADAAFAAQLRRAVRALPDAPAALQRSAVALWPQAAVQPAAGSLSAVSAVSAGVGRVVRHIAAALSFDSWATPGPALAMRSAASPTRQLIFSAEGRDVDLRIAPGEGGYTLSGQVLGPDAPGVFELLARHGDTPAAEAVLDALGEFRLERIGSGVYRMALRLGDMRIELPPLDVGQPPR